MLNSKPNHHAIPDGYDSDEKRHSVLPVGQLYWPEWDRYESVFRDIFERQYYTNHGKLGQQFEARLQEFLQVKHVVCVSNATIGLIMVSEALDLHGRVIVPAFTFVATPQSLSWAGVEPVFCDVDPTTHQLDPAAVESLISDDVSGILAVNLWGNCCDTEALAEIAERHRVSLFFDSAQAFACERHGVPIGNFGAAEVFSFHATKVLSAAEGGCIATNDDALAAKLRNIRSSYGAGPSVPVVKTSNGRMSEAHAAIGLLSLEHLPTAVQRNRKIRAGYKQGLSGIPGVELLQPGNVSASNHQSVVCQIDREAFGMSRDELLQELGEKNIAARRYFYPGAHRVAPYMERISEFQNALPVTDRLCVSLIQLPCGALVGDEDVDMICRLIRRAGDKAKSSHRSSGS